MEKFIHITDTYAVDLASKIMFDYNDHANFYAYGYVSWNIPNQTRNKRYLEIGERGNWVSSIIGVGEETLCICMLNAMTGEPVRQLVLPFVFIDRLKILDGNFENNIIINFGGGDLIKITIPKYVKKTNLKQQNGMRKRICDALENMNRRRNRKTYENK